jgi:NADPH:quinone reductase-like Zn-dependent oxidoreductase
MKAVVQERYGSPDDVLELRDIEVPVVKDDEVLVRVHAASVHADVWHVLTGLPYVLRIMGAGLRRPKNPVPGTDVAGVVEAVGKKVTRFQPGDEVFGETIKGMQWVNGGAYAEYATAPEDALALKPANVTFEQAAAVPTSALIALGALRGEGKIQAGQKVLVRSDSEIEGVDEKRCTGVQQPICNTRGTLRSAALATTRPSPGTVRNS